MKKSLLILPVLIAIICNSCKKEEANDLNDSGKISAPVNFNWRTTRDVQFSVEVSDTRYGDALQVISIYNGDPSANGQLITEGSASVLSKFKTRIDLATSEDEVYVVKSAPDGTKITQKVPVSSGNVNLVVSAEGISGALAVASNNKIIAAKTSAVASPDCNSGCDISKTLTQNDESLTLEGGKTLCVSGSNKSFNLTIGSNGGTLRICGSGLTLKNLNNNSNGAAIKIIVTATGVVTLPTFNFNFANNTLENYGNITFSENLALPGKLYNYGTITVNKDYNINSLNNTVSTHFNEGTITVAGQMNINSNTTLTNSNSITTNYLNVNSSGTVTNNCKLIVKETFIDDNLVYNNSYMKVGLTKINSNAFLKLGSSAMFQTNVMDALAGSIVGVGTTSLVKVVSSTNNNIILEAKQTNNPRVKGAVQYCDNVIIPTGLFADGAKQGCDIYIAKTDCNGRTGNGTAPATIKDTDGDGVADINDKYPNDANKAYNNYSLNYSQGGSTVAFEDKWPVKGDYDMNDVVINYKYLIVTNAANKVVQVKADYTLLATGGDFQNGAGIQFNIPKANASNLVAPASVSFEAGQDSVVLILFTNSRAEQTEWNTDNAKPLSSPTNYAISFDVANGASIESFGVGSYNPFIWNNGSQFERGFETHLRGKSPTKLAKRALFNTGDDNSNAGIPYITADNLPWAIELPIANFAYPKEQASLINAYSKFNLWAASNGTLYTDWYSNTASGYRNSTNIFQAK